MVGIEIGERWTGQSSLSLIRSSVAPVNSSTGALSSPSVMLPFQVARGSSYSPGGVW
jgi:hypothetical protein